MPGQPSQLALVLLGQHKYISRPLDMLRGRLRATHERQRRWQRDQATERDEVKDDPRVCPPAIAGQLTLIRPRRHLTIQHEQRIRHRPVRGHDQAEPIVQTHAAEHGLSRAWQLAVSRMVWLALAIRDADGDEVAGADAVNDLPLFAAVVTEILRRAGLLQPGVTLAECRRRLPSTALPGPLLPPPTPRSCESCQSWGFEPICGPCRRWVRGYADGRRPVGRCIRCHRDDVALSADLCRGCTAYTAVHGPAVLDQPWTQLWLGGPLALRITTPAVGRPAETPPPVLGPSPGLVDPAQGTLFELQRHWTALPLAELPVLSARAKQLVDQFDALASDQRWGEGPRTEGMRTLRILLAWLAADAPIPEVEITALATTIPGLSGKRVIAFLAEQHLLVPDPAKLYDPHQQRVERAIEASPVAFADDLHRWVTVLRGQGRRRHRMLSWETISKYVGYVRPVLHTWQTEVGSLREITREHVTLATKQRKGNVARGVRVGLRSLFRALKQEREDSRSYTDASVVVTESVGPTMGGHSRTHQVSATRTEAGCQSNLAPHRRRSFLEATIAQAAWSWAPQARWGHLRPSWPFAAIDERGASFVRRGGAVVLRPSHLRLGGRRTVEIPLPPLPGNIGIPEGTSEAHPRPAFRPRTRVGDAHPGGHRGPQRRCTG